MLLAALLALGALTEPVQINSTTQRFYDLEFNTVCYIATFHSNAPAISCVVMPTAVVPPVLPARRSEPK